MLFKTKVQINGDHHSYRLSPLIKRYTLRDLNFRPSSGGNFVLKRSLGGPGRSGYRFKLVIKRDLRQFKMDITDPAGLRKVNLFNGQHPQGVTRLNYLLRNLILRRVLVRLS